MHAANAGSVRSRPGRAEVNAPRAPGAARGELVLRVLSALALIPFALFVVWAGGWWLAVGAALFAAAMGYEWTRMSGQGPVWLSASGLAVINLAYPLVPVALLCAALAGFALVFAMRHRRDFAMAAFGMLYVGGMPFALQLLRGGPWDGQTAALILMAMVWASDSGAFFTGRALGGPALTPDSPNKTWAGAAGGVLASMAAGTIAAELTGAQPLVWIAAGAGLSVTAQFGDLMESQLKRGFSVKDASGLVPGHGGVMDRVDGLGAVCVIAVAAFLGLPGFADRLGF